MKEMSILARIYLCTIYAAGMGILVWHLSQNDFDNLWMLLILSLLASLALIFKVEGATNRSHYTFSFLIYGFTFALYGTPAAILVIAVSNLVEWLWNKPAWYIQLFNAGSYVLVMQAAGLVYDLVNPNHTLISWQAVTAIAISMAIFNLMNHLAVGIVLWLARGENFKTSGVFEFFPIMLDMTLLCFGASLSFVWMFNHFALLLFMAPIYLIYGTLRVPALERKTETDSKTGLFNHSYFRQQFFNELNRANRFDRPLAVIMADLDLLRNINNTYGHLAGDEVLVGIARVLKQSVRDYDVVARFGGEEFAILLPETTLEEAYVRAESIRKAIEETEFTVPTSVTPIRATMSFGIACRESFSQTPDEIIHNADTALYHSKLSGRNRAFAFTNDAYMSFIPDEGLGHFHWQPSAGSSGGKIEPVTATLSPPFPAPSSGNVQHTSGTESSASSDSIGPEAPTRKSGLAVNIYIGAVALAALLSFAAIYRTTTPLQHFGFTSEWISLLVICVLIAAAEWFSVDLYFRQTAISTSAIPILAGYLLFGPIGIFAVSLAVALALLIKYRSPISRFVFNFSNHMLAGTLCTALILLSGRGFREWDPVLQAGLSLACATILYLSTTWLIALGMSFDLKQPARLIWREQYSWLALYYAGIGFIAYGMVFGYERERITGILFVVVPMVLLRLSQKQYIERTRQVVTELREKNQELEKRQREINNLNEGLLETLAEIIDLRDPYVLGHSKQVAKYATEIARLLGLPEKQVELVRRAGLLHDIGKLGTAMELLSKPGRLTAEEYEEIKKHASLGAALVEKSPFLRPLAPIIRHHHEYYNGRGYPDGLKGNNIPIEARILAVADAIDAMAFDRPYQKGLPLEAIVSELNRCSQTQFDPLVVDAAAIVLTGSSRQITVPVVSRRNPEFTLASKARPA